MGINTTWQKNTLDSYYVVNDTNCIYLYYILQKLEQEGQPLKWTSNAQAKLAEFKLKADLDLIEGSMTVLTTRCFSGGFWLWTVQMWLRSNSDVILFVENALQEVLGSLYHHQSKGYDQVDGQVRLYSLASSCLANFSQIMSLQPSHGAGVCPLSKRAGCWRTNVAVTSSKLATW